jgi:hypothetical protein
MKFVLACLLAPLAPIVVIGPIFALMHGELGAAGPVVFACVAYGYPIQAFVGLPLYLMARSKGWLRWWQCGAAGALAGSTLPFALMVALLAGADETPNLDVFGGMAAVIGFGALLGAVAGFVFWLIALSSSNKAYMDSPRKSASEVNR